MKNANKDFLLFVLFIALMVSSLPALAQNLDDIIENPRTVQDQTRVSSGKQGASQGNESSLLPIQEKDIVSLFPIGFPSLERLVDFLHSLIEKFLGKLLGKEIAWDQPKTPGQPVNPVPTNDNPPETPAKKPPAGGKNPPSAKTPPSSSIPGAFPSSVAGAETGSQFLTRTENMNPVDREKAIIDEILKGNIPEFLRNFKEVTVKMKLKDGKEHSVTYKVLPDYLAIGSNSDFVRAPMSPIAAQLIADRFGCILPTTKMVDDIYKSAQTKLSPQPMSSGKYANWQSRMTKNEFFREHQRLVEEQRAKFGHQLGDLVAGHKKDVVISNFLDSHPKNVVIYGWHDKNNGGRPIQGYGYGHENTYADYSHGIRLISKTMVVDGQEMSAADVLKDPVLSKLLSNEGPMNNIRATR